MVPYFAISIIISANETFTVHCRSITSEIPFYNITNINTVISNNKMVSCTYDTVLLSHVSCYCSPSYVPV